MIRRFANGVALLLLGMPVAVPAVPASAPLVRVGRIDTPIHPVAANYLQKLLADASRDGASLVVVTLSTPGGLFSSTRDMTSAILASRVPVATFVYPPGAQAASVSIDGSSVIRVRFCDCSSST